MWYVLCTMSGRVAGAKYVDAYDHSVCVVCYPEITLRRVPASSWNEVLIRRAAACGVRWPSWLSRDNTPRNASRLPLRCGRRVCGVWRETSFLQDQLGERVAVGQSVPWSRSDASNGSQSDRSAFCLVPTSSRVFRGRIGVQDVRRTRFQVYKISGVQRYAFKVFGDFRCYFIRICGVCPPNIQNQQGFTVRAGPTP